MQYIWLVILVTVLFFLYFLKEGEAKKAIMSLIIFIVELVATSQFNVLFPHEPVSKPTGELIPAVSTQEVNEENLDEFKDDFIIYDSDRRKLEEKDLEHLSQWELRIARNEIYARKGRIFKTEELSNYFNQKRWYSGTIQPEEFTEKEKEILSPIEFENAVFIDEYEKSLGYYYD